MAVTACAPAVSFDHNALRSAMIVGANVIALTRSGYLLRFDRASLSLTAERLFSQPVRVMGGADGASVLVGFEGGRIGRIDVSSLAEEAIVTVPGWPEFVGRTRSGEQVVVFADPEREANRARNYRIWQSARKNDAPVLLPATMAGGAVGTFFVDSHDRLWRGTDNGEWGGSLDVVELASGKAHQLHKKHWGGSGVYGFTESNDGRTLAFGGTMHMQLFGAFIANLEPESASRLYWYRDLVPSEDAEYERWLASPEPHVPIAHVLERANGSFWVLGFNQLIEASPDFKTFRKVHEFSLRSSWGRPDAIGSYPAIVSAMLDGERLVLATQKDGLVEFANGQVTSHRLPDETAASPN